MTGTRRSGPFILQIVGYKNSGKTTLVTELIRRFKGDGCTVGTAKHDAHSFTIDTPGTDTWKHGEAGADITAISSSTNSAVLLSSSASLTELLAYMHNVDIVLVEGFKPEPYPKLVLLRSLADIPLLHELANPIAAIVWSSEIRQAIADNRALNKLTILDINQPDQIYSFLLPYLKTDSSA
ncbi:Molybdopterin-guanine dinucleotide biosynthesis adapter protein [Paenibacillus plantiphilus]|uniref:Molybdopterin-guanine dinucleotide biosynthesis adapter protein n=1 Tax=Paenibacillus plantiphilus TaxID=2905650 RepID=A0ABN8H009_9BACL|nr:molybdopterin-guanine dinucleotide biosynthesis protein B [Paenibacillus plantiphilus]CAH1223538.1 Molybdopterin-guanine dinucleotide biosynthesis adapter protein [Paenibacillus plantiphilus]